MKFKINLDNVEHQVDAAADGTLAIGGDVYKARVSSPSDDRRTVQVGDNTYEVRVVKRGEQAGGTGGSYILEVAGERVPVVVAEVAKGAAGSGAVAPARDSAGSTAGQAAGAAVPAPAAGSSEAATHAPADVKEGIWAPVPGKIVNVLVKAGDTVKEGDLVLILEAMKMENELHAPKQATVAAVLVKKGDQAERGQLLVAFE